MIKVLEKSGKAKTGAEIRACFRVLKAVSVLLVQANTCPFLSITVKGLLIMP